MRGKIASQELEKLRSRVRDELSREARWRIPIEVWERTETEVWDKGLRSGGFAFPEVWITALERLGGRQSLFGPHEPWVDPETT